jgi:hypothetical protein
MECGGEHSNHDRSSSNSNSNSNRYSKRESAASAHGQLTID